MPFNLDQEISGEELKQIEDIIMNVKKLQAMGKSQSPVCPLHKQLAILSK